MKRDEDLAAIPKQPIQCTGNLIATLPLPLTVNLTLSPTFPSPSSNPNPNPNPSPRPNPNATRTCTRARARIPNPIANSYEIAHLVFRAFCPRVPHCDGVSLLPLKPAVKCRHQLLPLLHLVG